MGYTSEEIEKAIKLARHMAESEARLALFKRSEHKAGDLQPTIDTERRILGGDHASIIENQLAEKLLPQARVIIQMERAREKAIQQTSFGKVMDSLMTLLTFCDEPDFAKREALQRPFRHELDNEHWGELMRSFASGDKIGMLTAMQALLVGAQRELVRADMPPKAPEFQMPE